MPSDPPKSNPPKRRSVTPLELVQMDGNGKVSFTNRGAVTLLLILALTGGGGSLLANWGLASSSSVEEVSKAQAEHAVSDNARHVVIDDRLDGHDQELEGITAKIGEVQEVQHWQAADQAAERVAQEAPKARRQEAYKRLFRSNIKRLKDKKLPCSNLDCTN